MTNPTENKQTILSLVEVVWRQGKLERLSDFWTNNYVNHADPSGVPGLESLQKYHAGIAPMFSELSDISITVDRQIAESDLVTSQIRMNARHTGELFGMPGTGKLIELITIRIDRLKDKKIAEHWSVADIMGLMQQLKS